MGPLLEETHAYTAPCELQSALAARQSPTNYRCNPFHRRPPFLGLS